MNPGSQMMTVTLTRDGQHQPWGFRMQGGSDFNTPLSLQMVNPGSVAERFGLKAGDAVLKINEQTSDELSHDQAKEVIMRAGNQVTLALQRGAVTFWKPTVTKLDNIRPEQINLDPSRGEEVFVQKTSLAANKQPALNIGSAHNRSAKGFPGAFGGSGQQGQPAAYQTAPMNRPQAPMYQQQSPAQQPFVVQQEDNKAVVHSQYNSPMGLYSQDNVSQTYNQQADVLTGGMQGMTVTDENSDTVPQEPTTHLDPKDSVPQFRSVSPSFLKTPGSPKTHIRSVSPSRLAPGVSGSGIRSFSPSRLTPGDSGVHIRSVSPTLLAAIQDEDKGECKRSQSPSLLTAPHLQPQQVRSVSPTMMLIMEEDKRQKENGIQNGGSHSARFEEVKDGQEIKYTGYQDHSKQSRSFRLLNEELENEGPPPAAQPPMGGSSPMAGFKSVSAPTTKPPSERPKQQLNQCAACSSLIMGVFVKIGGMPLHAECFKCVKCGMNLKQKGYFNIEDKLYCEDHAKQMAQRPNDNCNWIPTPVYK